MLWEWTNWRWIAEMITIENERRPEAPWVESVTYGRTECEGAAVRPAETNWHMVVVKARGQSRVIVVGPWTEAGVASWGAGGEILWIKFKLGTYMPHLPTRQIVDRETILPNGAGQSFYLNGSDWQFPNYENVDTFVERLRREEVLVHDPVVAAALQGQPLELSRRTVRHRFQQATGLTHSYIRQYERAQKAAARLAQGGSILDTVFEAGYFDQPHLTRALKRFYGYTPGQLAEGISS